MVLHHRLLLHFLNLFSLPCCLQLSKDLFHNPHLFVSFLSVASTPLKLIKLAMDRVEVLQLRHNNARLGLQVRLIAGVFVAAACEKEAHLSLNRTHEPCSEFSD